VVRSQYGINQATADLAKHRLELALDRLSAQWRNSDYLIGNQLTIADLTAAALLSPLALIPFYRQSYPWLFDRITQIHQACNEPLPPGLT